MIVAIGCLACIANMKAGNGLRPTGLACEWDHLNEGGKHGGRRLGDDASIGLCAWHHRGVLPSGFTQTTATLAFGPSWAVSPNGFRAHYGTRESLLPEQNRLLAAYDFPGL
jgi:hypothetical protein